MGYYRKFCPDFANIVAPTDALQEGKRFRWSVEYQVAFTKNKKLLCMELVLKAPDFDRTLRITVDACNRGRGSILIQKDEDGNDQPVCYYFKKFNKHQRVYSTIGKEVLALIASLKHLEVYLSGRNNPVTVFTDHNRLEFINRMKGKNRKKLSCSLILAEFNIHIRHINGSENIGADSLSRIKEKRKKKRGRRERKMSKIKRKKGEREKGFCITFFF